MIDKTELNSSEHLTPVRKKNKKSERIQQSATPSVELFQREGCAASHIVRQRLSELGLDFVARNVAIGNPLKHEQLVRAGGKDQTPFFIDHVTGTKLYESTAILAYLEKQYGKPAPTRVLRWAERVRNEIELRSEEMAWAVREPMERVQKLTDDAKQALQEFSSSWTTVRKVVFNPLSKKKNSDKPKTAQPTVSKKPVETYT